ncbi:hypothetical protein LY76DRAFT_7391 [Colletotrichum caudatum]|nr:hypothetical protein LY76DRAFT_7391 [Colletotrichum caudatum]
MRRIERSGLFHVERSPSGSRATRQLWRPSRRRIPKGCITKKRWLDSTVLLWLIVDMQGALRECSLLRLWDDPCLGLACRSHLVSAAITALGRGEFCQENGKGGREKRAEEEKSNPRKYIFVATSISPNAAHMY